MPIYSEARQKEIMNQKEKNILKIKEEVQEKRNKEKEEEERHIQIGLQKHATKKPLEEIMSYMEMRNQKYIAKKQRLLDES